MNTTAKTLTATVLVAIVGAAGLVFGTAGHSTAPQQEIVKLERVVIVGKRAPAEVQVAQHIEQLPRVVIVGRRAATSADGTQLAQAKTCAAQTVC